MNYKFFGNSLDLLKFDLLTHIMKEDNAELFYIPMLTEPEPKKLDPKYKLYDIGYKNKVLYEFMLKANEPETQIDVPDLKNYFREVNLTYKMISFQSDSDRNIYAFENIKYFTDENRLTYFQKAFDLYQKQSSKSLIFIDPDVGLDIGVKRRVRSMKKHYLKVEDLQLFLNGSKKDEIVCYFQHLGNPTYSIQDRLKDLKSTFGDYVLLVGYERILASIIFIFKIESEYLDKKLKLKEYVLQYEKTKHFNKIIFQ